MNCTSVQGSYVFNGVHSAQIAVEERYDQQTELASFVAADTLPAAEASSLPERERERESLPIKKERSCGNTRLPARLCALLSLFAFTRRMPGSVVKDYRQSLDI